MFENVLDWLIRNQSLAAGIIIVIAALIFVASMNRWVLHKYVNADIAYDFERGGPVRFGSRRFIAILIVIAAGALVGKLTTVEVVDKTAALAFPSPICPRADGIAAIVFIHGWNGDAEDTWRQFPRFVCSDTRFSRIEVVSVSYPTFMARRSITIGQLADWIDRSLSAGLSEDLSIAIIAHSMGGLIAREIVVLRALSKPNEQPLALVEIGTPHLGAKPARLASTLGLSERLTSDMAEDSTFLANHRTRWNRVRPRPPTYCYTSPLDTVVTEASALFQCDSMFTFPQWGHSELVKPEMLDDDRYQFPMQNILQELGGVY